MNSTRLYLSAINVDYVLHILLESIEDSICDELDNDILKATINATDNMKRHYAMMEVKSIFIAKHVGATSVSSLFIADKPGIQYQFDFHDSNAAIAFKLKYDHVYEYD